LKHFIKSYFTFSRLERVGIISVLGLTVLIFMAGFCVRYFVHPVADIEEQRLNLAWQQMQQSAKSEVPSAGITAALFPFDPNTLDSAGFTRLGLSAKTIKYLLNWRRKGKHFYKKEDLKPLYSLDGQTYTQLAPYIVIAEQDRNPVYPNRYQDLPPLPDGMDLNTVDSATLLRLDGIGTILAHKIIQRREALGSFLNTSQLLEVYKFQDTVLQYLKQKLVVYPRTVKKINLNTATETQLSQHPYIGPQMAKNILLLRDGLNKYEKTEQLRQVPLMNEEKYRKIAPYCTIE
jgi:competence protein ComEA